METVWTIIICVGVLIWSLIISEKQGNDNNRTNKTRPN